MNPGKPLWILAGIGVILLLIGMFLFFVNKYYEGKGAIEVLDVDFSQPSDHDNTMRDTLAKWDGVFYLSDITLNDGEKYKITGKPFLLRGRSVLPEERVSFIRPAKRDRPNFHGDIFSEKQLRPVPAGCRNISAGTGVAFPS